MQIQIKAMWAPQQSKALTAAQNERRGKSYRYSQYIQCVPNNVTRVILNILYSCKYSAMKFSMWYPSDLSGSVET